MDWTTIADTFVLFMQVLCALFIFHGAVLAIASVLPEEYYLRRAERAKRRIKLARPTRMPDGDTVPNL